MHSIGHCRTPPHAGTFSHSGYGYRLPAGEITPRQCRSAVPSDSGWAMAGRRLPASRHRWQEAVPKYFVRVPAPAPGQPCCRGSQTGHRVARGSVSFSGLQLNTSLLYDFLFPVTLPVLCFLCLLLCLGQRFTNGRLPMQLSGCKFLKSCSDGICVPAFEEHQITGPLCGSILFQGEIHMVLFCHMGERLDVLVTDLNACQGCFFV